MPADIQAHFFRIADMLQEFGPQAVGLPHVRFLQDKLWEMRIKGRDGIARAIYVADKGRQLMVLHVFTKKTEKTPQRAIQTATERLRRIKSD
jgi:phage-related protein